MPDISRLVLDIYPAPQDIPESFRISSPLIQDHALINGEIVRFTTPMESVYSCVRIRGQQGLEKVLLGKYPLMEEKHSLQALQAAVQAYDKGRGFWPTLSTPERILHVENFTRLMIERRNEIVKLLMWEIGKNLADSEKEFDRTIDYIRDTIDALKELDRSGSRFEIQEGILAQIRRAPLGVVLCMGPYNYPLNETFTTLIPALIMGNTVIFKPPKLGVLLHQPLLECYREAFPAGVVNTVYGDGETVIGPLMKSGQVDVLAFIGSTKVADILKHQHPKPHMLKSVLGLGAKNAGIFLADCDLEKAVEEAVLGSLSYNGQRCTALKILFVHQDICAEFVRRFSEKVNQLKPGMPWTEGVKITPLPVEGKPQYLLELVQDAEKQGAKVQNTGGGSYQESFYFPAVLYPVNENMRIYHEEQFGPLVPVVPFSDINEPVEYIINSRYGQQVSLFGNNPDLIASLIDPLVNQVCRVNLNSQCQRGPDVFPFTGRKDSAEGTLSVSDALKVFSIRTLVSAKLTDQNKTLVGRILKDDLSSFLSTDFIF